MSDTTVFSSEISARYTFRGASFVLGGGMLGTEVIPGSTVSLPLSTMNRHGLIAGATGTGKTKTLQKIVESLSKAGVPTVIMDIKGDVSGISMAGSMNEKIESRLSLLQRNTSNTPLPSSPILGEETKQENQFQWKAQGFPSEFYTLSGNTGVKLRSTVSEFGPVLFSRLLDLNDTQSSVMGLIFKYCDDSGLALLDLTDVKKVLQYLIGEGKTEIEKDYGMISTATVGTIMRKIVELEGQGADLFFGEPSFDPQDFLRKDESNYGYVNIFRLMDMQSRPKLFSTFMLSLLTEIYGSFPEMGDMAQPKLVIIIDEAHLLFDSASKTLLDEMEMIIKLIRSKGVGIFFCTQNPIDIPASILSQLGLKVQHALRAFTANDREAIKKASQNFPESKYYTVDEELTVLGVGEALITTLDEHGIPTTLVKTMIAPPESRMDTISDDELSSLCSISPLTAKYNTLVDRESATEILERRVAEKNLEMQQAAQAEAEAKAPPSLAESIGGTVAKVALKSIGAELGRSLGKSIGGSRGGTVGAQIVRGVLGSLFR